MTVEPSGRATPRFVTRPALQAGLVAFVVGVAAQVWAHHQHVVFAYWDAQAHLDIARRVTDSVTPGLQMLGTVWLPVPHLLMLPFILVDRWWWSGLAGGIVGLAAFVTIAVCLHDLLVRRTASTGIAWLGTAFVIGNPSLWYLQTTAMTEPVLLACIVASVCALDRWSESRSPRALLFAGSAAALAVGTRYDGWFYVVAAAAWLSISGLARSSRTGSTTDIGAPSARRAGWRAGWRAALIFALPSAIVVAAWLGYNWAYFGDPLEFQRGIWSAQAQQSALAAQGALPTAHHPVTSLWYYLGATVLSSGVVLTGLGLLGAASASRRLGANAIALLLLTALPFNVLALWGGQSAIQLPWVNPAGVLNVRYGVMMLPGLAAAFALMAAHAVDRRPSRRQGILLAGLMALVIQGAFFAIHWPRNAGALREGLAIRDGDPRQQAASDWLASHYDDGRVLVDEAVNISPRTRIPLRDRVYRWTWQLGAAALAAPEREVDWVVVDELHRDGVVARALTGRAAFDSRFDRAFEAGGLEIWRRR